MIRLRFHKPSTNSALRGLTPSHGPLSKRLSRTLPRDKRCFCLLSVVALLCICFRLSRLIVPLPSTLLTLSLDAEPIVVDGADHWEVECVLAERTKDRRRFVLVKWLGFDITSATWEPLANIPDQFIQQYRERVHQESQ